ncbi:MAG: hypothetical protein ACC645_12095 [Pirellulales bacterium]
MTTRSLVFLLVPIALVGPLVDRARSQGVPRVVRPANTGVIDFGIAARKQIESTRDRRKAKMQRYLALRIDEIDRTVSLAERQRKRLEMAAKGATEHAIDKWFREMLERQEQLRAPAGNYYQLPADVVVEDEDHGAGAQASDDADNNAGDAAADGGTAAEAEVAANGQADAPKVGGVEEEVEREPPPAEPLHVAVAPPVGPQVRVEVAPAGAWQVFATVASIQDPNEEIELVTGEKVWTRAIDTVLTDAQKKACAASVERRAAYRRRAAVAQVVALLDEQLFLSEKQRIELAGIVDEAIGQWLFARVAGMPNIALIMQMGAANAVRQLPTSRVEEILSEPQRRRWSELADQRGGANLMVRPLPAAPLAPAAPFPAPAPPEPRQ